MLEHTVTDKLAAVGDIVDLEHMRKKSTWRFASWHRQVLAHLLRKQAQYFPGNHDPDARGKTITRQGQEVVHRSWIGKKIFGVSITNEDLYADPKGRMIKIKHGDDFDDVVFGKQKGFWYAVGDAALAPFTIFDAVMQQLPCMHRYSLAATLKRWTKTIINKGMGVEQEIIKTVDADPKIQGILYGHSHMGGFKATPGGKILLNDGCSTEHVQAMVHDRHGTFALLTWHKTGLHIEEENGSKRELSWQKLGLDSCRSIPTVIEDEFSKQADRVIRVLYRLAPPKRRLEVFAEHKLSPRADIELPSIPISIQPPAHVHRPEQHGRRLIYAHRRAITPTRSLGKLAT